MDSKKERMRSSTAAIHAGFRTRDSYNSASEPVFFSTTFTFPSAAAAEKAFENPYGENSDFIYSRMTHPNAVMVEERVAAIEQGGGSAAIFSSGLTAIFAALTAHLPVGGKLAVLNPIYGGTRHMLERFFSLSRCRIAEYDARAGVPQFDPDVDVVFFETPTNPTLTMVDITNTAAAAKAANPRCLVIVDNTFMGALQSPFVVSENVDLIVYSGTKYMGGHSNILCGAVIGKDKDGQLILKIKQVRGDFGGILPPFECWQLLNSLKTYALRMRIESKGALKVAEFLAGHPRVAEINYPGLWKPGDKYYDIYRRQCTDPGAMICFYLKEADRSAAFRFQDLLKDRHHILLAVSLGGVESLICHPRSTTHACMSEADLARYGITENLIRLSVGLEEPEVLIEDLAHALDKY